MGSDCQHLPGGALNRETGSRTSFAVLPKEPRSQPRQPAGMKFRDCLFKPGIFPEALEPILPDLDGEEAYPPCAYVPIMLSPQRIESDRKGTVLHIFAPYALLHLALQYQREISKIASMSRNAFGNLMVDFRQQQALSAQRIDNLSRELPEVWLDGRGCFRNGFF